MNEPRQTQRAYSHWRTTWRQLHDSMGDQAPRLRLSLVCLMLAATLQGLAFATLVPVFRSVLSPSGQGTWLWITLMLAAMAAATLLRWHAQGFDYTGRMALATHALRSRLGEQLRRMPLETIRNARAGEIHATLLGSVDENLGYSLMIMDLIFSAAFTPLATALVLMCFDWRPGFMLLLVIALTIPFHRWRRPAFARGMRKLAKVNRNLAAEVIEYVQGLPVLRSACCAGERAEALQAGMNELERVQTAGHRKGALPNLIIASVVEISLLLSLAAGAALVMGGHMELAVLAATFVIMVRFAEPLSNLVLYASLLEMIEAALEQIQSMLSVAPLPQIQPPQTPEGALIRFEAVTFQYEGKNEPALNAFSAVFPARTMVALVGPSGAGKTTITRLLMRQADPRSGRITFGGADLRAIPSEILNTQIATVFQEVFLFDDTVLANIRMGRPDASDEAVKAAAQAAHCNEFIERLPQGWNTRLGEGGARLSGGERQRLSIARALLKDAQVIILDEPTAALDTESERFVQAAIDVLVRNKTVIVIAHRLPSIATADLILVIDEGRCIQQGTHEQLLGTIGRYRAMWQAQGLIASHA